MCPVKQELPMSSKRLNPFRTIGANQQLQHNHHLLGTVHHTVTIYWAQYITQSQFTGHSTSHSHHLLGTVHQSSFAGHSTSYSHHLLGTVHHTVTKALHLPNIRARPWTMCSSWHIRQKILSIFYWTTVYTYMTAGQFISKQRFPHFHAVYRK